VAERVQWNLQEMAHIIKPKRTLEEFLSRANAPRVRGLEGGVVPQGTKASKVLYTFKAGAKDKIVSITDFPILSKQ